MAAFPNLFNGQLLAANVFSANFSSADVLALLKGIATNPGNYGLNADAATVASRFLNTGQTALVGTVTNPITVSGLQIRDLGAALGYLFSTQRATEQNLGIGYRPILHSYGRVLTVISVEWAMSCVIFDPTTSNFHYGATIPLLGTDTDATKNDVKNARRAQLQTSLPNLPAFTKRMVNETAKILANVRVPEQTVPASNLRKASGSLIKKYETAVSALIASTDGGYPTHNIVFKSNLTDYNTAVAAIKTAEVAPFKNAIDSALAADGALRTWLQTKTWIGPDFGHCAETFPFIHIVRTVQNRGQSQGLAMMPQAMLALSNAQLNAGTVSYDQPLIFRRPCQNCTQVLELASMQRGPYNAYLENTVKVFDPNIQ